MNRNIKKSTPKENKKNSAPIVIIRVNPEELVYKSEEEIRNISDRLNKNLRIARSRKDDVSAKSIEKEICYLQRETKYREKRKVFHQNLFSK